MECLARQVEELEAIEAIYGYESFVPCAHLNFVRELVDGGTLDADTAAELPELFFTLVWPTAEAQEFRYKLMVCLPRNYPETMALKCTLNCPRLEGERAAVEEEVGRLAAQHIGEESILQVVDRARALIDEIVYKQETEYFCESPPLYLEASPVTISRRLIWFHHIKSLEKRKCIVRWSEELGLSGFCKPGFPGILLVEGRKQDCEEFLARLKSLKWQAMAVRGEMTEEAKAPTDTLEHLRRFRGADEPPTLYLPGTDFRQTGRVRVSELPEEGGMALLSEKCRLVGLDELFLTALKIVRAV